MLRARSDARKRHLYTEDDPTARTSIPADVDIDITLAVDGVASSDPGLNGTFSSSTTIGESFEASVGETVLPAGSLLGVEISASCPVTNSGMLVTGSWHVYIEYEY